MSDKLERSERRRESLEKRENEYLKKRETQAQSQGEIHTHTHTQRERECDTALKRNNQPDRNNKQN